MKNKDIMKFNIDNWPLPNEYLLEIGRIAALWATLESHLNLIIGNLAGFDVLNDPTPFILLTHTSFPQRIDMLSTLCEQRVDKNPNLKEYKSVIGSIKSAQLKRNRFMHNGMAPNSETRTIEMAIGKARGTLKTTVEKVDIDDIRKASLEIHQAQLDLHKLISGVEISPVWERRDDRDK